MRRQSLSWTRSTTIPFSSEGEYHHPRASSCRPIALPRLRDHRRTQGPPPPPNAPPPDEECIWLSKGPVPPGFRRPDQGFRTNRERAAAPALAPPAPAEPPVLPALAPPALPALHPAPPAPVVEPIRSPSPEFVIIAAPEIAPPPGPGPEITPPPGPEPDLPPPPPEDAHPEITRLRSEIDALLLPRVTTDDVIGVMLSEQLREGLGSDGPFRRHLQVRSRQDRTETRA